MGGGVGALNPGCPSSLPTSYSSDPMVKKQGSQLCNRQVCFFIGETLELRSAGRLLRRENLQLALVSSGVGNIFEYSENH
jgi:hypothetical protein